MVSPITNSGPASVDSKLTVAAPKAPIDTKSDRKVESSGTPAARFAKLGPPIDVTRVGEICAAIASGSYTVDADRLAAAMIALDLPAKDA